MFEPNPAGALPPSGKRPPLGIHEVGEVVAQSQSRLGISFVRGARLLEAEQQPQHPLLCTFRSGSSRHEVWNDQIQAVRRRCRSNSLTGVWHGWTRYDRRLREALLEPLHQLANLAPRLVPDARIPQTLVVGVESRSLIVMTFSRSRAASRAIRSS